MPEPNAILPPRMLRTEEAARWLRLSGRTLEKHRCSGTGPSYRRLGGRVVYVLDDLQAWVDAGTRISTANGRLARVRRPASERRGFVGATSRM